MAQESFNIKLQSTPKYAVVTRHCRAVVAAEVVTLHASSFYTPLHSTRLFILHASSFYTLLQCTRLFNVHAE